MADVPDMMTPKILLNQIGDPSKYTTIIYRRLQAETANVPASKDLESDAGKLY